MAVDQADRNPIEVLSEEFLERIRRGERVTPEDYAAQHPELADEILALFPALLMMEDLGDATLDPTGSLADEPSIAVGAMAGRLGEFRLLREVGRGGMGVVYEAEQESLGRRVALKVLPSGALTDAKQVRRFEREARAAARLHHTNIVPIFGVGQHEGTHYYVMQFIQGQGLDAVLAELKKLRESRSAKSLAQTPATNTDAGSVAADIAKSLVTGRFAAGANGPAPHAGATITEAWNTGTVASASAAPTDTSRLGSSNTSGVSTLSETDRRFAQAVARIGIQVADALAHAHGQGILHRDVKPSNLLLDRDGTVWVTDFGLAKATGADDLTHTGDIIGTVRYMAPERFQGEGDARADLYALGLTLYELLALRPAFDDTDRASLIRQVTQEDPPRLRRLNRHVPLDLETIIHKVIARDPGQRYDTAGALADDLQRFLDGRPILARRVSAPERLYRWSKRNKALAGALGSIAFLLVATAVVSIIVAASFFKIAEKARIAAREADTARIQADASRHQAELARHEAEARRIDAENERRRAQVSLAESQASLVLARKAVDDSFTKVSESALVNVPGLRPLRRDLLESARAFYEEFVRRGGDDPAILADLAAAQARVGRILTDLGEQDKARGALGRAAELYAKMLAVRPDDRALLERQSEVWHRLGDLDYRSDPATANPAYQKATAIRQRLAAMEPAEPRFRMALSRSLNGVAITSSGENQLDAYRRSLTLRLKLADEIPQDPDLLHGISESFLNLGIVLWNNGHREEASELAGHSIDYGRAGLARRPHDLEFASDLAGSYTQAAAFSWQLGHRDLALALSEAGVAYLRKRAGENPEVRIYRDLLSSALLAHAQYARGMGRTNQAIDFSREAAETLEKKPDADTGTLATAAFYRVHIAEFLAGDFATRPFEQWPEPARHEADVAIADLRAAVTRGFRGADVVRADTAFRLLLARDDLNLLLAEMERPSAGPSVSTPKTASAAEDAASPLDRPGRLDEDRFLGELTIGLLEKDTGEPGQVRARLEAMLARIDARRKSNPKSPALEHSAETIRERIGEQFWKDNKLADAKRLWDEVLAPLRQLPDDKERRQSVLAGLTTVLERVTDRFEGRGLWEQAAVYDDYHREATPDGRSYRSFESGLFALQRDDVTAYREIVAEAIKRREDPNDFWTFNALRTATLSPDCPVPPKKLVELAERLVAKDKTDGWHDLYRIALGDALFRAGRDQEALDALVDSRDGINGKASIALVHAHAGRSKQARRWLASLERDLERTIGEDLIAPGADRQARYIPLDVLRAEVLRRQAYKLLCEPAPELRSLRLQRGDALWRLREWQRAEAEFTASIAEAPDIVAALINRAWTFELLDLPKRADLDLAEAARRKPHDPRPWVVKGKLLAQRGRGAEADAAYSRAAELASDRLDPFLEAGWWVAGPYRDDMNWSEPPEQQSDPAQPLSGERGQPLRWAPGLVNEDRFLPLLRHAGRSSSSMYAMTHLFSDRERTALLCLHGEDRVRIWLNGLRVFDSQEPHTYRYGSEFLLPITLRPGRNTLLARVNHSSGGHRLRLRSDDFELDRAYLLAEFCRWREAADSLDRAELRGEFLQPWAQMRQIELHAALGNLDRCLAGVIKLTDWDGTIGLEPYEIPFTACLLPNDVVSHDRLVELAREGIAAKPGEPWRKLALGLAHYRAGHYRDAIDQLTEHISGGRNLELPILAMAHWRLGEKNEARNLLARTDANFEAWCRERADGRGTAWLSWWFDGPRLATLRREAHLLISGRQPDDAAALKKVGSQMGNLIDDRDSPTWAYDLALRLEPESAIHRKALAARLSALGRLPEAEPLLRHPPGRQPRR
jgi:serine/threonine protein kinase